jgi:hypothetical protein
MFAAWVLLAATLFVLGASYKTNVSKRATAASAVETPTRR